MIWFVQSSLDDPLDLGQFSCTVVNVSFAVVNAQGASPEKQQINLEWPSYYSLTEFT